MTKMVKNSILLLSVSTLLSPIVDAVFFRLHSLGLPYTFKGRFFPQRTILTLNHARVMSDKPFHLQF